jgi:hypothetical protein
VVIEDKMYGLVLIEWQLINDKEPFNPYLALPIMCVTKRETLLAEDDTSQ